MKIYFLNEKNLEKNSKFIEVINTKYGKIIYIKNTNT